MLTKPELQSAWVLTHKEWQRNEEDDRTIHQLVVDFTLESINSELATLHTALNDTTQLMCALAADPAFPKDQRGYIQQRIDTNKKLLSTEQGVENA